MKVGKLLLKAELSLVKLSRILGTQKYMGLYVRFLQRRGAKVDDYEGDGFFAPNLLIDDSDYRLISIGRGTTIATDVIILTHDYSIRKALKVVGLNPDNKNYRVLKPVTIGKEVFIGARSTLLPGTEIGDNVIIAAGSLVKGNIPPATVWGGVPAKQLCTVEEYAMRHHEVKDYCL